MGDREVERRRVVVIDDDNAVLGLLVRVLEDAGYEVFSETQLTAGLQTIALKKPVLVISDVHLSSENGAVALQGLRQLNPELPLIIISGSDEVEAVSDIRELRPAIFLKKPFNPAMIREAAEVLLRARSDTPLPRELTR